METQSPEEDIAKLMSGMDSVSIEAEHAMAAAVGDNGRVDKAQFVKLWPGGLEAAEQMFQQLDVDSSGDISLAEMKSAVETHQVTLSDIKPVAEPAGGAGGESNS